MFISRFPHIRLYLWTVELFISLSVKYTYQGCKLLSDIGQCPTKFGKCPSKSNFDRTLVRSQKKLSHTFFAVTKSDCKFTQFAFCNKIYEAFYHLILLNVAPEWHTYLSRDLYIFCDVYMSDQI